MVRGPQPGAQGRAHAGRVRNRTRVGTGFLDGDLGMWLASRADTPTFRTIKDFTWDVAPMPMKKTKATILHSDAYCVAAPSKNKDATWDFIQYALGPRGQVVAAKLGRTVPSLKSIANSPAFLDPTQPPANSKVYLDVIPTITPCAHPLQVGRCRNRSQRRNRARLLWHCQC